MSKKFKLNPTGVGKLLKSQEMQTHLDSIASGIQGRLGEGYEKDTFVGKTRVNAMVWAESRQAKKDNAEHNTILKAVR